MSCVRSSISIKDDGVGTDTEKTTEAAKNVKQLMCNVWQCICSHLAAVLLQMKFSVSPLVASKVVPVT